MFPYSSTQPISSIQFLHLQHDLKNSTSRVSFEFLFYRTFSNFYLQDTYKFHFDSIIASYSHFGLFLYLHIVTLQAIKIFRLIQIRFTQPWQIFGPHNFYLLEHHYIQFFSVIYSLDFISIFDSKLTKHILIGIYTATHFNLTIFNIQTPDSPVSKLPYFGDDISLATQVQPIN